MDGRAQRRSALSNVAPSLLLDRTLFDFSTLKAGERTDAISHVFGHPAFAEELEEVP